MYPQRDYRLIDEINTPFIYKLENYYFELNCQYLSKRC
jgi:hypothetical protein